MCMYMTNVITSAENQHEMYRKKDWQQQQETCNEYHILFWWYRGNVIVFFVHYKIYQQKGCPGDNNICHPNLYRFLNYSTSWFIQEKLYKYMSVLTACIQDSRITIDCLFLYHSNCPMYRCCWASLMSLVNKWAGRRFLHHVTLWRQLLPQFKYLLLVLLLLPCNGEIVAVGINKPTKFKANIRSCFVNQLNSWKETRHQWIFHWKW